MRWQRILDRRVSLPDCAVEQPVRNEGPRGRRCSRSDVSRLLDRHGPYVPLLLVGRLADTATTLYGLQIGGVYERNAAVAWLMEAFGPGGGMLLSNLVSIAVVVVVVELGVASVRPERGGIEWPVSERLVVELGYLPAVVLSLGAASYNLGVIAAA
jgi:hypothetical protein